MENFKCLMGAKVGDLFHSLIVPALLFHTTGRKSDFHIIEACDKFETSFERTFEELMPIMDYQPYIENFSKYRNGVHEINVDLNHFRNFNVSTEHANITFIKTLLGFGEDITLPYDFKYLYSPIIEQYKDYTIVSRKPGRTTWNDFVEMQYRHIFDQFEKKLFVSFNGEDYQNFPLKNELDLLIVDELFDFIKIVNSCKLFLANCSGPLCFASALNTPRIGETGSWVVGRYKDDHLFSSKSEIFSDEGIIFTPETKYLKRI
jgi:hypothetical protein